MLTNKYGGDEDDGRTQHALTANYTASKTGGGLGEHDEDLGVRADQSRQMPDWEITEAALMANTF